MNMTDADKPQAEQQEVFGEMEIGNRPKFIAVISEATRPMEGEPGGTDLRFVYAKTKKELSTLLSDPNIESVHAIFKGKELAFVESRKISF